MVYNLRYKQFEKDCKNTIADHFSQISVISILHSIKPFYDFWLNKTVGLGRKEKDKNKFAKFHQNQDILGEKHWNKMLVLEREIWN